MKSTCVAGLVALARSSSGVRALVKRRLRATGLHLSFAVTPSTASTALCLASHLGLDVVSLPESWLPRWSAVAGAEPVSHVVRVCVRLHCLRWDNVQSEEEELRTSLFPSMKDNATPLRFPNLRVLHLIAPVYRRQVIPESAWTAASSTGERVHGHTSLVVPLPMEHLVLTGIELWDIVRRGDPLNVTCRVFEKVSWCSYSQAGSMY